jgi:hypothetical protein
MDNDFIARRVAEGLREPLGIPAFFLTDQLGRGIPAVRVLSSSRSLVSEYAGAEGYATDWGQIIEQTFGHFVAWRINPAGWWERFHSLRQRCMLLIPDLIDIVQPCINASIVGDLPRGVAISGRHPNGRSHPHTLVTPVLVASTQERAVRHWMGTEFLPRLLPAAFDDAERRLCEVLGKRRRAIPEMAREAT